MALHHRRAPIDAYRSYRRAPAAARRRDARGGESSLSLMATRRVDESDARGATPAVFGGVRSGALLRGRRCVLFRQTGRRAIGRSEKASRGFPALHFGARAVASAGGTHRATRTGRDVVELTPRARTGGRARFIPGASPGARSHRAGAPSRLAESAQLAVWRKVTSGGRDGCGERLGGFGPVYGDPARGLRQRHERRGS